MRYLVLAVAVAAATPAFAYFDASRLSVTAASNQDFTVEYENRARLTDYWCRAGRYIAVDLGLPRTTRIYRLSPEPRGPGEGISFTLDAARSTGSSGIATFGPSQDGGLSAGHASGAFCHDFDIKLFGEDR